MLGGLNILLLDAPATPPAAPTIIVVGYQSSGQVLVRVLTGWTRIKFYYPDINGTVIYDTDVDGPPLSATVINGDTYDNFLLEVPGGVGPGASFPAEATDTAGGPESDPTPFDVPALTMDSAPKVVLLTLLNPRWRR